MQLINQAQIIKFHNDRSKEFADDFKRLGWKCAESQLLRFNALASAFPLDNASVLDVGCGYADFKIFLDKKFINVSYTGIDLMPAFIHEAARRFANDSFARFIHGDFENVELTPVDYVFSCGALSYRNANRYFPFSMIQKMLDTARKGIAFTLLNEEVFPEHSLLKGYNKTRIRTFCLSLSDNVKLIDDYLEDDFMIVIKKI